MKEGWKEFNNTLIELIPSTMSSWKSNFKMTITTFFSKKKCIGTKNLESNGLSLVIETTLSFMPKPSLEERKIEFTGFSSSMVLGLMIAPFFKMKLKVF